MGKFYSILKQYRWFFVIFFINIIFLFGSGAKAVTAPYNLKALTAGYSSSPVYYQINLGWNYDHPEEVDGFRVYRTGALIATVGDSGIYGKHYFEYSDTTLSTPDQQYAYYVVAYKGADTANSNISRAYTSRAPNTPAAPTVDLVVTNPNRPKFSFTYSDPATPTGDGMSAYRIIVSAKKVTYESTEDLMAREMWDSGKIYRTAASGDLVTDIYYNDADGVGDNNDGRANPLDWDGFNGLYDYYVKVQVWDTRGLFSNLSATTTFKPTIAGAALAERFDNTTNKDATNTTADWNNVYGEARLKSFATTDTYVTLVDSLSGINIKPAVFVDDSNYDNIRYYVVYYSKSAGGGNYGLFYNSFDEDGAVQLSPRAVLVADVGTSVSAGSVLGNFITNDIACDTAYNLCGVVYSAGPDGNTDAYFLEINSETGEITIPAQQLNGDSSSNYPNEIAPTIAYGANGSTHKYLVSWYEDEYSYGASPGTRKLFYKLINRDDPGSATTVLMDSSIHSNAYPSAAFNSTDKEFGLIWSRGADDTTTTNSEVFFNIIDWSGNKRITTGSPVAGNKLTSAEGYSNYSYLYWDNSYGTTYGTAPNQFHGEYYVVWKDARNYTISFPERPSEIDLYFMKLAGNGGPLTGNLKLTDFPSRRKYIFSESSGASCNGHFYSFWLDDRGFGNDNNYDSDAVNFNGTFNGQLMEFAITDATSTAKDIYDSLFSTVILPTDIALNVIDAYNTQRGNVYIVRKGLCPNYYFAQIFDQGGQIYLQRVPNQTNVQPYDALYDTDHNVIQSNVVFTSPSSIGSATLYASDATPAGTGVTYYLSNNNGTNWEAVTNGVFHSFVTTGTQLKWKAVLSGTTLVTPKLGSIAFNLSSSGLAPDAPQYLRVDGWGPPANYTATTTQNFRPEFGWSYSDPGGLSMSNYRIQVCTVSFVNNVCPKGELMWDSGKTSKTVSSPESTFAYYNDKDGSGNDNDGNARPLDWHYDDSSNYDYYHWQIKVWNANNMESAWSYPETGSPSEPVSIFRYGNDTAGFLTNLINADDFTTLGKLNTTTAQWYLGAKGEIRVTPLWPTTVQPSGYYGTIVDDGNQVGAYDWLALDSKSQPHICYFDKANKTVKYAYYDNASDNWTIESNITTMNGGGYACSLTIDHNDNPQISFYSTSTLSSFDLVYGTKSSGSWATSVVQSGIIQGNDSQYVNTSIVVDHDNLPSICYYVSTRKIRCARYNGSAWTIDLFADESVGTGYINNVTIDGNDNLHLAYRYDPAGNKKIRYRYFNHGNGQWDPSIETIETNSVTSTNSIIIAVDKDDNPGIAYNVALYGSNDFRYAKKIDGTWTPQTVYNYSGGLQPYTSLVYDSLNNPRIAYNGPSWGLFYASSTTAGVWTNSTVENLNNVGRYSSLFLDNADIPSIAYGKWDSGTIPNDLMYIRQTFTPSITYTAGSININPTADNIYGIIVHPSYSIPSSGSIGLSFSADGGAHWVTPETACLEQVGGCQINFSNQGGQNWGGNDLRWMAAIKTNDLNYSPRFGSIAIEKYNVPPVVYSCSYYPPAIDPGQSVLITAAVGDELSSNQLYYKWCYDTDPPGNGRGNCLSGPIQTWTDYTLGDNPVNHTYNDPGIYNPAVKVKDELDQESAAFQCSNLFVGNVQIAWLETKFGNVFSLGNISGYDVPPELSNRYNATYKIESGGSIIGAYSQCEDICKTSVEEGGWGLTVTQCQEQCFKQFMTVDVPNFPKANLNYRNIMGDLQADPVIKELLNNPVIVEGGVLYWNNFSENGNFFDIAMNPEIKDVADFFFYSEYEAKFGNCGGKDRNILYFKNSLGGEIPLNSSAQINPHGGPDETDIKYFINGEYGEKASGLIVIDGDLHIYSGINSTTPVIAYGTNAWGSNKITDLASIAFIIKGDLIIDSDVTGLVGTFVVLGKDGVNDCVLESGRYTEHCGAIYTAGINGDKDIPIAERVPLTINGLVMAKAFSLNRQYFDFDYNDSAEKIINDGRAVLNPPPGLEDLMASLPNWQGGITNNGTSWPYGPFPELD